MASALNEALKKGGLGSNTADVDGVYIGFPNICRPGQEQRIDASITNEPTMTRAIEEGVAVRVAGNDVTYPDQQTAVTASTLITSSATGADVAERFMRAYLRGVRVYNDALKDGRLAGPKANEVIPILVKYTTIKDESMFRRMILSYCNPDGEVNVASSQKDLAFFRELGLIGRRGQRRQRGRWFLRQGSRRQARAVSAAGQLIGHASLSPHECKTRPGARCHDHARAQ